MTTIARTLRRAGRAAVPRVTVATQAHVRPVSWMAWEQPNPALYTTPSPSSLKGPKKPKNTQATRHVGETIIAPATRPVAGGSQEISVSGKTIPAPIQAGRLRTPFMQQIRKVIALNKKQTQRYISSRKYLPTTHICMPGHAATWPVEKLEFPDQPRVRRLSDKRLAELKQQKDKTSPAGKGKTKNDDKEEKENKTVQKPGFWQMLVETCCAISEAKEQQSTHTTNLFTMVDAFNLEKHDSARRYRDIMEYQEKIKPRGQKLPDFEAKMNEPQRIIIDVPRSVGVQKKKKKKKKKKKNKKM